MDFLQIVRKFFGKIKIFNFWKILHAGQFGSGFWALGENELVDEFLIEKQ